MVRSPRVVYITRYLVAILILLFFVCPYLRSHPPAYVRDHYAGGLRPSQDEKNSIVAEFTKDEFGDDLDGSALARLCASKTWFPDSEGIIVDCEPVPGGLGEVKNGQLNCIRSAIEIGAQLVLPRMAQRSTADISNLQGGQSSKGLSLDYMFSLPHLTSSLRTHCPQLKVYDSLDALYDKPSLLKPLSISLHELSSFPFVNFEEVPTNIIEDPDRLRSRFLAILAERLPIETRRYPVRVYLPHTLFTWPTFNETSGLRENFGKLLRTRDDAKILAGSALRNLAQKYAVALANPQTGFDDVTSGFLGVHLRTEKDARDSYSFPGYDDQVQYYFGYLENNNSLPAVASGSSSSKLPVIFLATGLTEKDDDVKHFRTRAAELHTSSAVLLKRDLLDAAEINVLNALSWDQRALVDYEILLRAETVLGIVESSFAWAVALRRAEAFGLVAGLGGAKDAAAATAFEARPGDDTWASENRHEQWMMWRDPRSRLFGRADRAVAMYLASWP